MSVVTDIKDQIIARLEAVLTTHTRLPNPYQTSQNAEGLLKQGYGVRVGAGQNLDLELGCTVSYMREYTVVIARRIFAKENDAELKSDTENALLEDLRLVLNDIESEAFLTPSQQIASWRVTGDSGIIPVFTEDKPFFQTEVVLEVKYFEPQA